MTTHNDMTRKRPLPPTPPEDERKVMRLRERWTDLCYGCVDWFEYDRTDADEFDDEVDTTKVRHGPAVGGWVAVL